MNLTENSTADGNQIDVLNAKVDGHYKHLTDRGDTLEKKAAAKAAVQDELIENNYQQLSEKYSGLDSRYSEKAYKNDVRVDEFNRATHEADRRHTDAVSLLQSNFKETSLRADQRAADMKAHFSVRCDDLETIWHDKIDSYDQNSKTWTTK